MCCLQEVRWPTGFSSREIEITYSSDEDTPWGEPTKHDEEFMYFLRHYASGLRYAPWNTFPKDALGEEKCFATCRTRNVRY